MKTITIVLFLFGFLAPASEVDDHLKILSQRLMLSQDQRDSIKTVLENQFAEVQAIKKDEALSTEQKTNKMRGLSEAAAAKIRDFLSEDQRAAFDEMQRVHRGHGEGHGQGLGIGVGQGCEMPDAGDHLKLLAEKLHLSQSQQARVKAVLENQLAQLQAARNDESLTRDDKTSKIRGVRESSFANIRDLLSSSQKNTFAEMRHESGGDCSMIWIAVE